MPQEIIENDPLENIREPETPETLYKYFPPDRIDVLESLEVQFSRPSQFNDTFDTHYLVPKSKGAGAQVYRTLLKSSLGILCLTERPDDHLMWVHYAKNHTGFVLGFNARSSFFKEKGRILKKVAYRPGPKVFAQADMNVCFYKSDVWQHEREWRCVRKFQSSEPRAVAIDPSLITHVIFGSKMEQWQIARVVLCTTAHEMMEHTQFLASTPATTAWTFENRPKAISLCDCCGGGGYLMTG